MSANSRHTIHAVSGDRSPLNSIDLPPTIHRVRQRIQLQIPPRYSQEPIISNLARRYEVEVNIHSALLAYQSRESGWFDLDLYGTPARIEQALNYLSQLQVEIWDGTRSFRETVSGKH